MNPEIEKVIRVLKELLQSAYKLGSEDKQTLSLLLRIAERAGDREWIMNLLEKENWNWDNQSEVDKTKGLSKKEWFATALQDGLTKEL